MPSFEQSHTQKSGEPPKKKFDASKRVEIVGGRFLSEAEAARERLTNPQSETPRAEAPKTVDVRSILTEKIANVALSNRAYEDSIEAQEKRMENPMFQTRIGGAELSKEDQAKSIQRLKDAIDVNTVKQIWLNFTKARSMEELQAQLMKDQEAEAKKVEKAYLERIQNDTPETQKKLKEAQTSMRAVSELYDEFNQPSH